MRIEMSVRVARNELYRERLRKKDLQTGMLNADFQD